MKHEDTLTRHHRLLHAINELPKRMLSVYSRDNSPEFVLHHLCNTTCFDVPKAAYFVDNPDFDCTKGVAGFAREEHAHTNFNHWDKPEDFTQHMRVSPFNAQVRSVLTPSIYRSQKPDNVVISDIAGNLGMRDYAYCSWNMKHDNRGFLVYEVNGQCDDLFNELFADSAHFLGFCPIH